MKKPNQKNLDDDDDDRKPPSAVLVTPHRTDQSLDSSSELTVPAQQIVHDDQRTLARREVQLHVASTSFALVAVVYYMVPPVVLVATVVFTACLAALLRSAGQYALTEVSYALQTRGLLAYLPSSLRESLDRTLDEILTDPPVLLLEYRHLLLYFLPLPAQQRNDMIAQLAPRHVDTLHRPTRELLTPQVQRWLLGDGSLPRIEEVHDDDEEGVVTRSTSRQLLFDDDESSVGLDMQADDFAGGLTEAQATALVGSTPTTTAMTTVNTRAMTPTPTPVVVRNTQEDDEEGRVLTEAITNSMYDSIFMPMVWSVFSWTTSWIRPTLRYGGSLAIMGTTGYVSWLYARMDFSRNLTVGSCLALGWQYYWRRPAILKKKKE